MCGDSVLGLMLFSVCSSLFGFGVVGGVGGVVKRLNWLFVVFCCVFSVFSVVCVCCMRLVGMLVSWVICML